MPASTLDPTRPDAPLACLYELHFLRMDDEAWSDYVARSGRKVPQRADAPVKVADDGTLIIQDPMLRKFAEQVKKEVAERKRLEAEGGER